MLDTKNNYISKLVKYSAYIALLNRLKKEEKIEQSEYEIIKKKIQKNAEKR